MPASRSKQSLPKESDPDSEPVSGSEPLRRTTPGNLFVLTGPSGVGKNTIIERVLAEAGGIVESVSVTTRKQRERELDGVDYFFTDRESFEKMKKQNHFIESAEFAGNYYGTPRNWVENRIMEGLDVVLVIEVQGAKQVKEQFPQSILIFLAPPTMDELEKRLRTRATEPEDVIAMRLDKAGQEMKERDVFHYEVVNEDIDQAVNNVLSIVYAERCRIKP
ncbi:MAG TPA: guanylate kinase [Candidatus Melainabacteria bacterium]|jgi:guanylate kinase|nr:guanylate kinase [Candidatus Melainabacteria bacterium]HIN66662.1 guanylate kinase [Candidatus Obscuribacterales bacterium]